MVLPPKILGNSFKLLVSFAAPKTPRIFFGVFAIFFGFFPLNFLTMSSPGGGPWVFGEGAHLLVNVDGRGAAPPLAPSNVRP